MNKPIPFLTDPEVTAAVRGALLANGFKKQDVQDGVQDVYVKVLTAFRQGAAVPADRIAMTMLCATVAKNHAIDEGRKAGRRKRYLVGPCDADEHTPLELGTEQRDPVDAGRQLEVLAQLFRQRRMPADGVDILEGVACRCSHEEIADDLGITARAVRGRLDTMRKVFRVRLARLGMLPSTQPLRVILSAPGAITALRQAA